MTEATLRAFLALVPPAEVSDRIESLLMRWPAEGRAVPRRNWHLTLAFLGEINPESLEAVKALGAGLDWPEVTLVLDRLGHFPGSAVGWLGPSEVPPTLKAFHAEFSGTLDDVGLRSPGRRWTPHVTLYRKMRKRPDNIPFEPIEWRLQGGCLMQSMLRPEGVEYRVLARWPGSDEGQSSASL